MRPLRPTSKRNPYGHIKKGDGTRSGLETAVRSHLRGDFKEEKDIDAIEYSLKAKKYHPDFRLANGIYIECKGWFKPADRQKHLTIKYQHPTLDIRFVFSNPNAKLSKGSSTTYASWCDRAGFQYAKGLVPEAWIDEESWISALLHRKAP